MDAKMLDELERLHLAWLRACDAEDAATREAAEADRRDPGSDAAADAYLREVAAEGEAAQARAALVLRLRLALPTLLTAARAHLAERDELERLRRAKRLALEEVEEVANQLSDADEELRELESSASGKFDSEESWFFVDAKHAVESARSAAKRLRTLFTGDPK